MKKFLVHAACGLLAVAGSAFAQQRESGVSPQAAERVYVQPYPGVFIEARLMPASASVVRWTEVPAAGHAGRFTLMARLSEPATIQSSRSAVATLPAAAPNTCDSAG